MVIRLGCMGLHDFGRRLRALGVWSSGWAVWGYFVRALRVWSSGRAVWGYMTLAEGLEP